MKIKGKYKKIFDDAWKNHQISIEIKPFPSYRNDKGYYGYIHYHNHGDVNLSLWVREAPSIDEVCEICVESIQQLTDKTDCLFNNRVYS